MQVQSTQAVTLEYTTSKTQKSNSADIKFDMSKPFDINTFSFEDYKNIDAKDLYEWTKEDKSLQSSAGYLKKMSQLTEDDVFNEIMFSKAQESYLKHSNPATELQNVFFPLALMDFEMPTEMPNRMKPNYESKADFSGGGTPFPNIEYYVESKEFINEIKSFPEYYKNSLTYTDWEMDPFHAMNYMNDILNKYEKRTNENNATLDSLTKNNRPNALYV
ncbi:hypothetical protein CRV03_10515 [Arcobacter sp. F155]|uniref:hypothetical protein n=1 Tax=Arcobacter sp. F155 TaxID=2044512 RepID=UPI00100A4FE1|nr:hypothetical protein [Arcobacter sp. F155]RXJ76188.1 hypothetical protein CRV03_10515 [Arcobacter sp. F155]